jgi:hypothetical protein
MVNPAISSLAPVLFPSSRDTVIEPTEAGYEHVCCQPGSDASQSIAKKKSFDGVAEGGKLVLADVGVAVAVGGGTVAVGVRVGVVGTAAMKSIVAVMHVPMGGPAG